MSDFIGVSIYLAFALKALLGVPMSLTWRFDVFEVKILLPAEFVLHIDQ